MERLEGIVQTVTYHDENTGYSVLKVATWDPRIERSSDHLVPVTIYQSKVFAGATMEFLGQWVDHSTFGRQFQAASAIEKKPATTAALEKYLGSGLIHGVGPATAKKIVRFFQHQTLEIFEQQIERLLEIPGIAEKKLEMIKSAWQEHRSIREVMLFLQTHGVSTIFAVKIYKQYGDNAISVVQNNPYQLARDIYGIGFFSADRIALALGVADDSSLRIGAAVNHVLQTSREEGHCYLLEDQITEQVQTLLQLTNPAKIGAAIAESVAAEQIIASVVEHRPGQKIMAYYGRKSFFDEFWVAKKISQLLESPINIDKARVVDWLQKYNRTRLLPLSAEQLGAVEMLSKWRFAILTGGPGCGKTTTTKALVQLLLAQKKTVMLAAPTGRAAQRMQEVIGLEAKTLHRLLGARFGGEFTYHEDNVLPTEVLIVDECSMLDLSLSAALLRAIGGETQVIWIGDQDQLPAVGAGNVLKDLIECGQVPVVRLTQVFRQAKESLIIKYAHEINQGITPQIASPFADPSLWQSGCDALFVDVEHLNQDDQKFLQRARAMVEKSRDQDQLLQVERHQSRRSERWGYQWQEDELFYGQKIDEQATLPGSVDLVIPKHLKHFNLSDFATSQSNIEEMKLLLKKIHPWSALHYQLDAHGILLKLYQEIIPKYFGAETEIQVLTPMHRGNLGTGALNRLLQEGANPPGGHRKQLQWGEKIFRQGDRVIQKKNNYQLDVFNGDIGKIVEIGFDPQQMVVEFPSQKKIIYPTENFIELDLAYAITIHKSQGSEFPVVIMPITTQHFTMLFRNLIYTGITRARQLVVLLGTRRALHLAIKNIDSRLRQTNLPARLKKNGK